MNQDEFVAGCDSAVLEAEGLAGETGNHGDAVGLVFRKKDDQLRRFLARRLGSAVEAEDVAQDAYARLLASGRPDPPRILVYRLWRIATNLAKDRLKLRAIRNRLAPIALVEPITVASSPEPVCEARERIALIERAMNELPPRCRQAFVMRMFDDKPFEDVALLLGVDVRTAQRYVARALAHCQRVVDAAERRPR